MYLSIKIIWINFISYTSLDTCIFETLEDVIDVSLVVIATHVAASQPLIRAPNICKCSAIHTVRSYKMNLFLGNTLQCQLRFCWNFDWTDQCEKIGTKTTINYS